MLKNLSYMTLTTGSQLLAGGGLFVLLARVMSPAQFGLFTYALSLSTMVALIVDYGLGTSLVRELALEPAALGDRVHEGLRVKRAVGLWASMAVLLYAWFAAGGVHDFAIVCLCTLGQLAFSFATFCYLPFRGAREFRTESLDSSTANSLHALTLIGVAIATSSILAVCVTLALSRIVFLFWATRRLRVRFGAIAPSQGARPSLSSLLWRGSPYAFDLFLMNQFTNIDAVILHHYVDDSTLGVYQGGSRLVALISVLPGIVLSTLLPDLSRAQPDEVLARLIRRIALLLAVMGSLACTPLFWFADPIVSFLYGEPFRELATLLPDFGLFLALRFACMPAGILLTARGHQVERAVSNLLALVLAIGIAVSTVPERGAVGMIEALAASQVLLMALYHGALLAREPRLVLRVIGFGPEPAR